MLLEELTTVWLNDAKERLRDSSYASYRASVARVLKYFGSQDIKTISKNDLKDVEKKLVESGGSYQTSRMMFNVLRLSLEYAVEHGMLSSNPARGYRPDKGLYPKTGEIGETKEATEGDVKRLLRKYKFLHSYHMPILLMYKAGLRSGEMMGLTWDYVDLKKNVIHVVRQLSWLQGRKYKLTSLRAESLVRDVRIDDKLKEQLARWKRDQKSRGLLRKKNSFVCIENDGSPINYNKFVYMVRKEGFTPQSIRKTYEDKEKEAVTFLKEKLSLEEIGHLREQLLEGVQQQAYG